MSSLVLGDETYSKTELIALLHRSVDGDASIYLAKELIAAKLNILNGVDDDPVDWTIAQADELFDRFWGDLPYDVDWWSDTGKDMREHAERLENFNDGEYTHGCDDDDHH